MCYGGRIERGLLGLRDRGAGRMCLLLYFRLCCNAVDFCFVSG